MHINKPDLADHYTIRKKQVELKAIKKTEINAILTDSPT